MERYVLICLISLCLALFGCDENNTVSTEESEQMSELANDDVRETSETRERPETREEEREKQGGYIGIVVRSPRSTEEKMAITNIKNQLNQYKALHGRLPESLEALKKWTGGPLPKLPDGVEYNYDPETGDVKLSEAQ